MKDAMGELNMTVVTIVAIGAIAAFFTVFLWPQIRDSISSGWDNVNNQTPVQPEMIITPNNYE